MRVLDLDYEAVAAYMAEHAPQARLLERLTAEAGAEYHTIWLDGTDVLHAWVQDPASDPFGPWILEREPAGQALEWIRETLVLVLDRVADPALYAQTSPGCQEQDQDTLEEMYAVELAAITSLESPRTVDKVIQGRIAAARGEVARLAGLRVHHIRAAFEGERGWQTLAATALRIDPTTVSNLLTDERERRRRRDEAARQARESAE